MPYCHARSTSASLRMTDCPFPELDMSGLTTQGMPTARTTILQLL